MPGRGKGEERTGNSEGSGSTTMAIEQMYQIYEKLNSAEDKTKLEAEYRKFLDAAHRSDKEKRLASQFITRFVEHFPELYNDAANAMLDLCEEEDPLIRKQVVKDLVTMCKKIKVCVPKIADVFCQLMYTADSTEMQNLQTGLNSLLIVDAKGTLAGIFSQISTGEELVREACIKYLNSRLKESTTETASVEFQRALYSEIRSIIKWVSEEDFSIFMDMLMHTKLIKQVGGNQLILDLLYSSIDLETHPDVTAPSALQSLFAATDYALPIFCSQIPPNALVVYYFTRVIPQWQSIQARDQDGSLQMEILKRTAELLLETSALSDAEAQQCMPFALDLALDILPPVSEPMEVEGGSSEIPDFNFSFCECILFFINKIGGFKPELLSESTRHEELRKRMLFLNRGAVTFENKLKRDFKGHIQNEKKKKDLNDPANVNKIKAFKTVKNLNTFIRELYQKPPKFNAAVILSWIPVKGAKRALEPLPPLCPPKNFKATKDNRELQRYQPPGKRTGFGPTTGGRGGRNHGGGGNFRGNRRRY